MQVKIQEGEVKTSSLRSKFSPGQQNTEITWPHVLSLRVVIYSGAKVKSFLCSGANDDLQLLEESALFFSFCGAKEF